MHSRANGLDQLGGIQPKSDTTAELAKVEGEGFTSFIVFKETTKGPQMQWVKVGKTDLNFVELKEGLNKNDIVYVLPSEGLIKSQQRFSERLRNRFS